MSTPAITPHASFAICTRSAKVLLGVMARNAGAVAMGSTMTNRELAARRLYSRMVIVLVGYRITSIV
jgi:hypothetical protein